MNQIPLHAVLHLQSKGLILHMDVIEHIKDMFAFLRKIKIRGKIKIFNIHLDLFFLNIINKKTLLDGLTHPGHIHFFTKDITLEILRNDGYEILDYAYTPVYERPGFPNLH